MQRSARFLVIQGGNRLFRDAGSGATAWDQAGVFTSATAAVAADGRTMLVGSSLTGETALIDLSTGQRAFTFDGTAQSVTAVAIAPDGRHGVLGSAERTITLLDLVEHRELVTWPDQDADTGELAFRADGQAFVATSWDGMLAVFDLTRPARRAELRLRVEEARATLARSPDDAGALATMGESFEFAGEDAWALELLERARASGAPVATDLLARLHWRLGDPASATLLYARALEEAPRGPEGAAERWHLTLCRNATQREAESAASR